jgi:hypothetical protein
MKKKVQAKTRQGYKGSGSNPKQERRVISKKKRVYNPKTKTKKHVGTREKVIQQQENGLWQDLNRHTVMREILTVPICIGFSSKKMV